MTSSSGSSVVVWEWCDDVRDWQAYDGVVSNYIEQHYRNCANTPLPGNLALGHAHPASHMYEVDLNTLTQTRRDTNRHRPIRRNVHAASSPFTAGISWQWLGDHGWQPYSLKAATILEQSHEKKSKKSDLASCGMVSYYVDLRRMVQVNRKTKYERQVQRVPLSVKYIKDGVTTTITPQASTSNSSATTVSNNVNHVLPPSLTQNAFPPPPAHSHNALTVIRHGLQQGMIAIQNSLHQHGPTQQQALSLPQHNPLGNHSYPQPPAAHQPPGTHQPPAAHQPQPQTPHQVFPGLISRPTSFGLHVQHMTGASSVSIPQGGASTSGGGRRVGSPTSLPNTKRRKPPQQIELTPEGVLETFTSEVKDPKKDECAICCEEMTSASGYDSTDSKIMALIKCKHHYHRACLLSMYNSGTKDGSLQCPTCKAIHGTKLGNCPPGKVTVHKVATVLSGYPDCGALMITYEISSGTQGPGDPSPGETFTARGFPRRAYLPDNELGNKVCRLLLEAWKRRLTFTIANSVTTGEQNTVVWNEIHHKTEIDNNFGHGYPDSNYLKNVLTELKSQGVTEEQSEDES